MKNLKYILTLLLIIIPIKVSALNGYTIESYDVDIVVSEDNIYDITETITANFEYAKHGIIRNIPIKNEVERLDGSTTKNHARISNLKVSDKYSTSRSGNDYSIKIGDANKTITGEHTYVIKYTYNVGKDPLDDMDEFYFNIIGDHWDTTISDITFRIEMPDDFDEEKLGFSSGGYGSTDNENIYYEVDDNVIEGYYLGKLNSYEGLTIRLELDEGYFKEQPLDKKIYLAFIVPIIGLIICAYIWFRYGRDDQVIETVEFYPPEGFNSLDLAYTYKGKIEKKDVTSLLVYLANKGYIKIEEAEEKSVFTTSNSFKITKLKEYDGNDENEKLFLEGLFEAHSNFSEVRKIMKEARDNGKKIGYFEAEEIANQINPVTSVTASDLYDSFYVTMNQIINNVNKNKEIKNKIFEKSASSKKIIMILAILISVIITIGLPTTIYASLGEAIMALGMCLFYVPFYAIGLSDLMTGGVKVFWLGFTIFHSSIFLMTMPFFEVIREEKIALMSFAVGVICIIGMIVFTKLLPKRTPYGNEMLGKIRGFKNFLETAEKEKLEAMVNENPKYFYDILPYTYVLGVSSKWISKFESIALQAPDWYSGTSTFDTHSFGTFMDNTMTKATSAMSSSPSSSGGGSSGGGSSGGGSGGGGGSSW